MTKTKFICILALNIFFCSVLIVIFSLFLFNFKINFNEFFTQFILLLTGMFSGYISSKFVLHKKLVFALIVATILWILYMLCSFLYIGDFLLNTVYFICGLNIYFGTFLGSLLSICSKTKRKGRK